MYSISTTGGTCTLQLPLCSYWYPLADPSSTNTRCQVTTVVMLGFVHGTACTVYGTRDDSIETNIEKSLYEFLQCFVEVIFDPLPRDRCKNRYIDLRGVKTGLKWQIYLYNKYGNNWSGIRRCRDYM
jgi:hypothetical protein